MAAINTSRSASFVAAEGCTLTAPRGRGGWAGPVPYALCPIPLVPALTASVTRCSNSHRQNGLIGSIVQRRWIYRFSRSRRCFFRVDRCRFTSLKSGINRCSAIASPLTRPLASF